MLEGIRLLSIKKRALKEVKEILCSMNTGLHFLLDNSKGNFS